MNNYEAVLDFDFDTMESVLTYGGSCEGSGGEFRSSDDRKVYERIKALNHDGYVVTIESHSLPSV